MSTTTKLQSLFTDHLLVEGNVAIQVRSSVAANQQQTNDVFSDKWEKFEHSGDKQRALEFQRQWYLKLYGFSDEDALRHHLASADVILDAGSGIGYKAAWFAELAPQALVIGMDFSSAVASAAKTYAHLPNLFFVQGDIASTGLKSDRVSYVSCDQVIMHTEDPDHTFAELARICRRQSGQVACYWYARKALPRELVDDHFRRACKTMTRDEMWAMSEQLTVLGKRLSALDATVDVPAIPALGIAGGPIDIQRFVYWNFLKCFWNEELGFETSVATNFDWYSPSNARRFTEAEVRATVRANGMHEVFFHSEEACFSGRFVHGGER